jgi:hypothetical protein
VSVSTSSLSKHIVVAKSDRILELRNRVYDIAVADLQRLHSVGGAKDYTKLPYVGLMQACKTTRSEFRDLWLENTIVPLPLTDRFIRLFLTDGSVYTRYTGTLQVFVENTYPWSNIDIFALVHLKAQCQHYKVVFHTRPWSTVHCPDTTALSEFVNFSYNFLVWRHWILDGTVGRIRFDIVRRGYTTLNHTKGETAVHLGVQFKDQEGRPLPAGSEPKNWYWVRESMMKSLRDSWDSSIPSRSHLGRFAFKIGEYIDW